MSAMLIIGGLFAIALLALIALVFTLRSTPRKKDTPTRQPASRLAQNQADTSHASDVKQQEENDGSLEITDGRLPAIRNHSQPSPYSRQFREFAIELHVLHRQVQEIDRRLGMLSQIMDRMEQSGNNNTIIEEEPHSPQHPSEKESL